MRLTLGFSPCPNDTFIFDAMVNKKIDTEGLSFELTIADVEKLNKLAFQHSLDITKLSYYAYAYVMQDYILLDAGSALGNKCGPLLISKPENQKSKVEDLVIAIPGKYTTANFLLSLAFPRAINKVEMLFSDIENAILQNKTDAGLIIHENRFTYQDKGLVNIIDLGEYWEAQTGLPIPLGGIVIKRSIPSEISKKVNRILRKSVEYAIANPASSQEYVKQYAQEMSENVRNQHIQLYVNTYSITLGKIGRNAIKTLFEWAQRNKLIAKTIEDVFLSS
ncbi:MAG: 1,4-dihydroxy-6-naphthoate synthase [Candidatus Jettenia sp.]|uniref:1,4-dihydroxy-6-naphtoate synthase n=1 Tax=Candidatus Jettenia caeni TaxID=247490 RepID=I3IM05_9BACT|nr:1,4-dihydroxy-6-naphthoate synthase [Candidatus Jettenia sp. AMX1]MBC6928153.1 1,4-dihydroxy-6-naphthoate synthase [Candidatus Jettenia sp.]NUN22243.1 1,4-dihydroxy-6-naphthoate synthase [Candidatus Jettenia caeni]KAA0249438.1 MAG: 1,4-dihydroxy-6-naphthoate synthase [Candidatus Jettenia sp. AMX1]MCE7879245.1 1,4-dihydroxy-6-naphthoate synthase [Candidatus Jettenia sp. AMX1]MCQ3925938.1 1,4-dihydroxy-6-naphthoate synthase [Candidatus Jettenia sp.]